MNVDDYLSTIRNLNLKDYTTYNASEAELVSCGLDVPVLSVSIDYTVTDEKTQEKTTKNFVLHVGRDPAEQVAAEEKAETDHSENMMENTIEEEQVTAYAGVGESKIIITSEKKDEQRVYYYRGEEVEMAGIRSTVRELTAQSFIDETPIQKEEISLTIYLNNEDYPQVQIQLYRYDGAICIAVVDKETMAFVKRANVVDLIEAVNAIILDSLC